MSAARVALLALASFIACACGAKTGPWIPCEAELTPTRALTYIVLSRHAGMRIIWPPYSESYWRLVASAAARQVRSLDSYVDFGLLWYPTTPLYEINRCDHVPSAPQVRAAPRNGPAIDAELARAPAPAGTSPLHAALQVVVSAIRLERRDRPAYIILGFDGYASCNPALDWRTCPCLSTRGCHPGSRPVDGSHCQDTARLAGFLRDLVHEEVSTLVVGIERLAGGDYVPAVAYDTLDQLAVAGGLPNPTGPRRYYSAGTPNDLDRAFADAIEPLVFCRLSAAAVRFDRARATLVSRSGLAVPSRDPSHRDGWDWRSDARDEIELYGPACATARAARARWALVASDRRCAP